MTEYLAPLDAGRALAVLSGLALSDPLANAAGAEAELRRRYPTIFSAMELRRFEEGALLFELPGAGVTAPLLFCSHLDAPGCAETSVFDGSLPAKVPLCRAHAVALLEALEELLKVGYRPCGDLLLALSMDGLNGGRGASSIAGYLKKRGAEPCFVLDCGGYATEEGFRSYMPKDAPLALVGTADRGELLGSMSFEGKDAARSMLRTGARFVRYPHICRLSEPTQLMLRRLSKYAGFPANLLAKHPRLTFPLLRMLWARKPAMKQFFWSERYVYDMSAPGTPQTPAPVAGLRFAQTVLPGLTAEECRAALDRLAGRKASITFHADNPSPAPSQTEGEAWDALCTAIEVQFERALIVPCLSPGLNDGRFYSGLCDRVYHFSPFLLTDAEAARGLCTVSDESLQKAVQFFRAMLSV